MHTHHRALHHLSWQMRLREAASLVLPRMLFLDAGSVRDSLTCLIVVLLLSGVIGSMAVRVVIAGPVRCAAIAPVCL